MASQLRQGRFQLVTSDIVQAEILGSPEKVKAWFEECLPLSEFASVTLAASTLRTAYLKAGIVTPKWEADALHVAVATVEHCRIIVSWNFKHIVHYDKIPLYNGVNLINGYDNLSINSSAEVIDYEN